MEKYKNGVFETEGHYAMLYQSDLERMRMLCNLLKTHTISEKIFERDYKDFCLFVTEYDRRRGTDFNKTFPELIEFKNRVK